VKEGEVPFLLRQRWNEVAESGGYGQSDTPPVTIADTEQYTVAKQRPMIRATATEAQHRLGEDKTDIMLQALAQAIAPVGVAVRVACPPANPQSPVPELDRGGRDVVRPEIESPTAGEVKAGVMPMAGQDPIFNRAPVKRKTEMRATIVESEELASIMHDQQRTCAAANDGHAARLQLLQCPGAYPIVSRRFATWVVATLRHRGPPR